MVEGATTTRLAWSIWAVCVALTVASLSLLALDLQAPVKNVFGFGSRAADAVFTVPLLAFPTVGALIAWRRPGNSIGWIFCGVGLLFGIATFADEYAIRGLSVDPGSLPAAEALLWLSNWLYLPGFLLAGVLLFSLFPDGRLLSRRWRVVPWVAVAAVALLSLGSALAPGLLEDSALEGVENPFGVESAEGVLDVVQGVAWLPFMASLLASAIAIVLRFRRASGEQRQQLKWIASAAALFALSFLANGIAYGTSDSAVAVTEALSILALTGIPIAAGIAILKYRLYEIDLIIRRTLVWGVLSGILAGLYFAMVLALQEVFSPIAGGSDLAIAGSTLAVAALFRPARRRFQALVDRRFYRRTYDAQRTLEAFSARLRDEVDLDALAAELRRAVSETLQPAHVSLWLRPRK